MEVITQQPEWFKDALAKDHRDDFIEVEGANIHFMEWGNRSNPSVIMVHGNHAHAHWFKFIGGLLADQYHFAVMSFSGMGKSDWRSKYDKMTCFVDTDPWEFEFSSSIRSCNSILFPTVFGNMASTPITC